MSWTFRDVPRIMVLGSFGTILTVLAGITAFDCFSVCVSTWRTTLNMGTQSLNMGARHSTWARRHSTWARRHSTYARSHSTWAPRPPTYARSHSTWAHPHST